MLKRTCSWDEADSFLVITLGMSKHARQDQAEIIVYVASLDILSQRKILLHSSTRFADILV